MRRLAAIAVAIFGIGGATERTWAQGSGAFSFNNAVPLSKLSEHTAVRAQFSRCMNSEPRVWAKQFSQYKHIGKRNGLSLYVEPTSGAFNGNYVLVSEQMCSVTVNGDLKTLKALVREEIAGKGMTLRDMPDGGGVASLPERSLLLTVHQMIAQLPNAKVAVSLQVLPGIGKLR